MYPIINFVKNQWLAFILLFLSILYFLYSQNEMSHLEEQKETLEKRVEALDKKELQYWKKLSTLKVEHKTIIQKEKILIQKEYDTIKSVDTMSTSELQSFFSNRYNKESSTE